MINIKERFLTYLEAIVYGVGEPTMHNLRESCGRQVLPLAVI